MFIIPISSAVPPIESFFDKESAVSSDAPKFSDVFKELFDDVKETQRITEEDAVKLVMGEIDDLHTVYINMQKAAIAVQAFSSVTNTALDSYKQIMQMNI